MAGVIGLLEASAQNEDQGVVCLAFHCTYVISNAVGVLLRYPLELPDPDTGRRGWDSAACNGRHTLRI